MAIDSDTTKYFESVLEKKITTDDEYAFPLPTYSEDAEKPATTSYLSSGKYTLIETIRVDRKENARVDWTNQVKRILKETKVKLSSSNFNNQSIAILSIDGIIGFNKIKKSIKSSLESHFQQYKDKGNVDVRSLFNLIKYIPELSKVSGDIIFNVDADLSLMSASIFKDNHVMHLTFKKNGEVVYNFTDKEMSYIRISGSSYFSGSIDKAFQINRLLRII